MDGGVSLSRHPAAVIAEASASSSTRQKDTSMTDTTASADATPSLPTDEELHDQIVNFNVADMPSNHEIVGNVRMALPTKVTALAPQDRQAILDELLTYPPSMREDKEAELVGRKVEELALTARLRSGPGANATPFQKAAWSIHREVDDLEIQRDAIIAKLAEVSHIDPVTEERTFRYAVGSARRDGLDAELQRLGHAIDLLKGTEGQQRLEKAKVETGNQIRAQLQEQAIAAEAEKRAANLVREAEINRRAASKARFLSPTHATHAA